MNLQPTNTEELQAVILENKSLLLRGGGTKTALSTVANESMILDMGKINGIIEYEPSEYTFTAYAGTPLRTIVAALAEHGQYLPFDPLLVEKGATIGGTVAANTSGSGRWRYGGVRDFILGIRFVDGQGRSVRSGGKVVKNAAGFDLSKFFVGSIGRFGALVEMTFKVFPQPRHYMTLQMTYAILANAMQAIFALTTSPLETDAVDIETYRDEIVVLIRLGGLETALAGRVERLKNFLSQNSPVEAIEIIEDDLQLWQSVNHLEWASDYSSFIKVPIAPRQVEDLEMKLQLIQSKRRYSAAGNIAWLAINDDSQIAALLNDLQLVGLRILGPADSPFIGQLKGRDMLQRMKQVLDPHNIFGDI
ncbi:MAG: FAD-binding protein [Anaerolineae bacterium]|nr:FAD-binding protein [Anaerolineae bacterium]